MDLFISNFFDQIKQSTCVHIVFDIDPIVWSAGKAARNVLSVIVMPCRGPFK